MWWTSCHHSDRVQTLRAEWRSSEQGPGKELTSIVKMCCSKNPKKHYNTERKTLHLLEGLENWSALILASNNPVPPLHDTFLLYFFHPALSSQAQISSTLHNMALSVLYLSLLAQVCLSTAFLQVLLMHFSEANMNWSENSKGGAVTVFKALVENNQLL